MWVLCPFLCVYLWDEGVNIVCVHEGGNVCLCICVLVHLRLCVRSSLRLHLTHHLSRPPPHQHALPVEDAAGALVVSRAGAGCSSERRPTLGGRLAGPGPTGLAGPRLGGGGAFGSPGPGPVCPGVGGCRWSLRACRHGTLGLYTVAVGGPTFGLSSALFGWRPRLSLRWFSWGFRALGGPRMFGARVFSMPASCLAGWGCCSPHTLLTFTWRNLMNTSALTHTGVHSSIHIGVQTGAHRHTLS